jgi:single-stranded DNA-binding protein
VIIATIDGRLANDAALNYTDNGSPHVDFDVIANFYVPNENQPGSLSVRCTLWREAENLVQHLTKGRQVFVIGEMRFSIYEGQRKNYINADCNVYKVTLGALPRGER